ncbi:MAG: hypothetical protein JSV31_12055 [Desulfobacterales bacterium]|nr:MAG: hypothetical protein JSV31_12055 [Desulfobacterales bacterium]
MYRITRHTLKIVAYMLGLIFFLSVPSSFAQRLIIHVKQTDNTLDIQANFAYETKNYTIPEHIAVIQKLETIYYLLEHQQREIRTLDKVSQFVERQYKTIQRQGKTIWGYIKQWSFKPKKEATANHAPTNNEIKVLLTEVGQSLYHPVQSFIELASAIEFVITEECLLYPFDATYYKGTPLFLHKPIIYSFKRQYDSPLKVSKDWKGFMISDRSTDPERGLLLVKELFPRSRYFDSHDVHPEELQQMERADFVLISANGGVQGMDLPHCAIRSKNLSHMQAKLVYLNSCQLGLRLDFIYSLHQAGTLYYIAPILSNEAGESSTKTMERFFRALLNGETPSYALYLTRKTLYHLYADQDNEFCRVMWRTFPFRVYRLN